MAYDHWADYEKHLNAMRAAHQTFLRDYNSLSAREAQYRQVKAGHDLMARQNALTDFMRYVSSTVQAGQTTQQLCSSAKGKLNAYIRLVKPFPQSAQHARNIDDVSRAVAANIRDVQARARAVRGY